MINMVLDSIALINAWTVPILAVIMILNCYIAIVFVKKINIQKSIIFYDLISVKNQGSRIFNKYYKQLQAYSGPYKIRGAESSLYKRTVSKLKKSGYSGEKSALIYLTIKYPVAIIMSIIAAIVNLSDIKVAVAVFIFIQLLLWVVLRQGKGKVNMSLQRHIYKIYKYLHNQISSGVKVTDTLKTVYKVIDDKKLKDIFIRLAARYELTHDIDEALKELRENFDVHEAEMLCVTLKQGVETGDNQELLARQEDIMFKKYFNYIQAETDSCQSRSIATVGIYTLIIVIMILIPLINEVRQAAGQIFIS